MNQKDTTDKRFSSGLSEDIAVKIAHKILPKKVKPQHDDNAPKFKSFPKESPLGDEE